MRWGEREARIMSPSEMKEKFATESEEQRGENFDSLSPKSALDVSKLRPMRKSRPTHFPFCL
jgi:hypothetical protein